MSSQSSRTSSPYIGKREVSPINIKAHKKNEKIKRIAKTWINLLYLFSVLPFIFYFAQFKPFYCVDGLNSYCIECPKHANCTIFKMDCKEGYADIGRFCVEEDNNIDDKRNKLIKIRKNIQKNLTRKELKEKGVLGFDTYDLNQEEIIDYLLSTGEINKIGNVYQKVFFNSIYSALSSSLTVIFLVFSIQFYIIKLY